jgi:chromosome segregation ATPase
VTNEQLLEIAKTDAKEASEEAIKLKKEAQDAFGLATQKTAESLEKQKAADEAITSANSITDVTKKDEELAKANQLKEEAKIATSVANTATNMAKKLEVDASIQQKEADLTNQYINQLEAVTKNKNNKEALTKLEEIQKELDNISKQKNQSDELFTSLKAEAELKKQELINTEKKNNSISNEINAIKNEAESLEKDLANESDKSIKENISAQIRELNSEIELKNKDLATNNQKITSLQNEVDGVNQELLVAAKDFE